MLKPLTLCGRVELGIEEMFKGKLWAYAAVVNEQGIGLGIAVANEAGYNPVPMYWCHADTWNEMREHAKALNRERGMSDEEADKIIITSMAEQNKRGRRGLPA